MAITTLDQYIAAQKQVVTHTILATASRVAVAANFVSLFGLPGTPGGGTLAGSSTTAGVVPDATVAGYPTLRAFPVGALGYLTNVQFSAGMACRLGLYDTLFLAGAYAFNANQTLTGQPSYSARIPDADYSGTEIWLEQVTAATGVQNVAVTYTNQAGTTGRTTGTVATAANVVGRMWRIPLQAGDTGVQKIESVVGSTATAGTFNILVMRPLWWGRVQAANGGDVHNIDSTGMPRVFDSSALRIVPNVDATTIGAVDLYYTIASA